MNKCDSIVRDKYEESKAQLLMSSPESSSLLCSEILKEKKKKRAKKNPKEKRMARNKKREKVDEIQAYLEWFSKIQPKTDCKPPPMSLDTYYVRSKIYDDFKRLMQITKENMQLLMNINVIQRGKGKLDNFNPNAGKRYSNNAPIIYEIESIEKHNIEIFKRIKETRSALPTAKELNKQWKKDLKKILKSINRPPCLAALLPKPDLTKGEKWRPRVYLEVSFNNGVKLGNLIISLFLESAPCTVINFIALCENSKYSKDNDLPHLVGSKFQRIYSGLYAECGDNLLRNGCTGLSTFNTDFYAENSEISHKYVGTLAMIPNEEGKLNSLFTISFKPLKHLEGKQYVFGRVIDGFKVLDCLEAYGTPHGYTSQEVFISKCGLLKRNY